MAWFQVGRLSPTLPSLHTSTLTPATKRKHHKRGNIYIT